MKNHLTKEEQKLHNALMLRFFLRRVLPLWLLGYVLILALKWWPTPIWLADGMAWLQAHMGSLRMAARVAEKYGESPIPNQFMQLYSTILSLGFAIYFLKAGLPELKNNHSLWFKYMRIEAAEKPWKMLGVALLSLACSLSFLCYVEIDRNLQKRTFFYYDSNIFTYLYFHCFAKFCLGSLVPIFFIAAVKFSFKKIFMKGPHHG